MKKILFVLTAIAVLVSCQKENTVKDHDLNYTYSFSASQESVAGKTIIDGTVSKWSGSEAIRVIGKDSNNYKFTTTVEGSAETAVFSYSGTDEVTGYGDGGKVFYAVYPNPSDETTPLTVNDETHTISGISVPTTQTAVESYYDVLAPVAVAYCTDGTTLSFKNVTALVKFQVLIDGVTNVTFSGNNGEIVSGTGSVSYNEGRPEFSPEETGGKTYVELTCDGEFQKGVDYYFAILPNTFEKGFKVELNKQRERYLATKMTVSRNTILKDITLGTSVPSLVCDQNHWAKSLGAMTLEGNYYVKKNVNLTENGFKVVEGFTWLTTIESGFETGSWHKLYKEIKHNSGTGFTSENTYDIYFNPTNQSCAVVENGADMPSTETCQYYMVFQNNWNWDKYLYAWDGDTKIFGDWKGVEENETFSVIDHSYDYGCWRIPQSAYSNGFEFIISNSGSDKDRCKDKISGPIGQDYFFYFNWTDEKGNHLCQMSIQ